VIVATVIGFTGTQNTGKTTLLNALSTSGVAGLLVDTVSMPRTVQRLYGKTLAEIVAVASNVPGYQRSIMSHKVEHLAKLDLSSVSLLCTDRSPVDFVAYAELWVEQNQSDDSWLPELRMQALRDLKAYSGIVFIPPHPDIPFETQPDRGSLETQQRLHELCLGFMARPEFQALNLPVLELAQLDLTDRVATVKDFLQRCTT
jgi:predicted ATPase